MNYVTTIASPAGVTIVNLTYNDPQASISVVPVGSPYQHPSLAGYIHGQVVPVPRAIPWPQPNTPTSCHQQSPAAEGVTLDQQPQPIDYRLSPPTKPQTRLFQVAGSCTCDQQSPSSFTSYREVDGTGRFIEPSSQQYPSTPHENDGHPKSSWSKEDGPVNSFNLSNPIKFNPIMDVVAPNEDTALVNTQATQPQTPLISPTSTSSLILESSTDREEEQITESPATQPSLPMDPMPLGSVRAPTYRSSVTLPLYRRMREDNGIADPHHGNKKSFDSLDAHLMGQLCTPSINHHAHDSAHWATFGDGDYQYEDQWEDEESGYPPSLGFLGFFFRSKRYRYTSIPRRGTPSFSLTDTQSTHSLERRSLYGTRRGPPCCQPEGPTRCASEPPTRTGTDVTRRSSGTPPPIVKARPQLHIANGGPSL